MKDGDIRQVWKRDGVMALSAVERENVAGEYCGQHAPETQLIVGSLFWQ